MDIVQFSDFHFGNENAVFDWREFANALSSYLTKKVNNPIFIISGDITFKGRKNGYKEAEKFFKILLASKITTPPRVIVCPGNHDIVDNSFQDFDRFSYALRRNNDCSFTEQSYQEIIIDNCLFKLFNSSYHLDHKYGLIDTNSFNKKRSKHNGLRIAITHHHLLNMVESDTSTIRNAYDFAKHLESESFTYVFHGHQHAAQNYFFGESSIKVVSARSGNYAERGVLNSVNIYHIDDKDLTGVALIPENSTSGITFKEIEL